MTGLSEINAFDASNLHVDLLFIVMCARCCQPANNRTYTFFKNYRAVFCYGKGHERRIHGTGPGVLGQ